ncbi:TPA: hypothetical protein ACIBFW_005018, partial [Salmonella enterica subsp. diarizonae serovar 48:i:z]
LAIGEINGKCGQLRGAGAQDVICSACAYVLHMDMLFPFFFSGELEKGTPGYSLLTAPTFS